MNSGGDRDKTADRNGRRGKNWLRWGITVILVVWAFILGVLVGQGTLANDQQLASLRSLSLSWFGLSAAQEPVRTQPPLRDPELNFYDELGRQPQNQKPETGPARAVTSPVPVTPPAPAAPPLSALPSTEPAPPARETAPLSVIPPTDTAQPNRPLNQVRPYEPDAPINPPARIERGARPPASSPPAAEAGSPKGRFTIQVGSFKEESQARQLAATLTRSGFPAYVSRTQVDNVGLRFRVRVGAYDNLDQAQNVATSLRVREKVTAYVTRNE